MTQVDALLRRYIKAWVAPIFLAEVHNDRWKHVRVTGTGFFLTAELVITCWHVVADPPSSGHSYVIAPVIDGQQHGIPLRDITRHPDHRLDLASAKPESALDGETPFDLSASLLWSFGTSVATFAYPLPVQAIAVPGTSALSTASEGRRSPGRSLLL